MANCWVFCYRYLTFDVLDACSGDDCNSDLLLSGYMSIVLELDEALTATHIMVVYAMSPDTCDIDKDGNARITKTVI